MKWCKTLQLHAPLRQVRLGGVTSAAVNEEATRQREQASYERGLIDGERRLSEQLLQQRADLLELKNGVLASLRNSTRDVVRQSESALIEIAIEVARRLVAEIPISAQVIEAAVRAAIAQADAQTELHVFLNPQDLALLTQCSSPMLLPGPGNESIHFHSSEEVTRAGCLVKTRFGVIDATRETKLDLIRDALKP